MIKKSPPSEPYGPPIRSIDFAAELVRQAESLPRGNRVRMMLLMHAEYWNRVAERTGV